MNSVLSGNIYFQRVLPEIESECCGANFIVVDFRIKSKQLLSTFKYLPFLNWKVFNFPAVASCWHQTATISECPVLQTTHSLDRLYLLVIDTAANKFWGFGKVECRKFPFEQVPLWIDSVHFDVKQVAHVDKLFEFCSWREKFII